MIKVRVDQKSLATVQSAVRGRVGGVYPQLRDEFTRWGVDWQRGVSARFTGTTGPKSLRNRSGDLQRSIKNRVTGSSLDDLKLALRSDGFAYARVQEFGGTITPKSSKYLMFPAEPGPAIYPTGKAKFPNARSFIERNPGQTFFRQGKTAETLLLFLTKAKPGARQRIGPVSRKDTANAPAELAYIGKKSVTLPGPKSSKGGPSRLGFFDTWRELQGTRNEGLARIAQNLGGRG